MPLDLPTALAPELFLAATVVTAVVVLAGAINGVAGFGFALVGTMALATLMDPATAVVFMIVPILSVNLTLVSELSTAELRACGRRFAPLVGAALVGVLVGMLALDVLPDDPLRVALGLVTLAFVVVRQTIVPIPGLDRATDRCFVETPLAMVGVGGISGLLFGGTNVGVQLVAYLKSCRLPHGLFVGVVAMVFIGLNGVRVVAAGAIGLYPGLEFVAASLLAAVPAVIGVKAGSLVRPHASESTVRALVLGLLAVIGLRLVFGGLGVA